MNKHATDAYRASSLQNASGPELVAACFREAQRALTDARHQIDSGTSASSYAPLERVRKIYTHLYSTLDLEAGGELAGNMQRLYAFVIEQTMLVASSYDLDVMSVLDSINQDMLGAWTTISAQPMPEPQGPRTGPLTAQA